MIRKSLYGEIVEFFNGKEWKSIKDYKKADKVLIYNPSDHTVFLSTPINYIKKNTKAINHVTSTFFAIDISDEMEFYGIPREDDGTDHTEPTSRPFHQIVLEDYHYFSHYLLVSTFDNLITDTSSMLDDSRFKIMMYAITMGECDEHDCVITFDNRKEVGHLLELLKKCKVRYKYDMKLTVKFRLPRDIDLFIQSPLCLSKQEVGMLSYYIVDNFKQGKKIKVKDTKVLDFIQMVLALNGIRVNVKNGELIMFKNRFTRLQSPSFKIEEKRVNGQYSFTIKNEHFIVLRSNGVIFVGGDYRNI